MYEKIAGCRRSGYDERRIMGSGMTIFHPYRFFSRLACGGALAGAFLAGVWPAAAADAGPVTAAGWKLEVVHENLSGVDNLALHPDGTLYATRELNRGRGQVVRLRNGRVDTLIGGLNSPDGLRLRGDVLYITEETADGRVLEYDLKTGRQREIARLHNPEGIGFLPDGELVVTEDTVNGRIMRLNAHGVVDVVTGGLSRPEGIVVTPDGTLIFCESITGRVVAWRDGEMNVLMHDLDEPDQIALGADGEIWVTEDTRSGRLLRYQDGLAEITVSGLSEPQGVVPLGPREVLVAEQGRGRILRVTGVKP
jgi:sugar lactone lactonase YvrE